MNKRQKRLIEVYEHLRRYFGIHTKTGFAEALHYGRTSLSAAMNGDISYLTDNLFKNICEAYPGVFNLDYLLTGEGKLLIKAGEITDQGPRDYGSLDADLVASLKAQLADKDKIIGLYEEKVKWLEREVTQLRSETELARQSGFQLKAETMPK